MPEDTPTDKDFLSQIAHFAARKAQNGVYIAQMYSASLGAPAFVVVAIGEQALALQQIVMSAAVPDESALIERVSKLHGNGGF